MNGVDPPYNNRFRDLDPTLNKTNKQTKNKRYRVDDFMPLPQTIQTEEHIPRYLVASALPANETSEPKSLASYNVFQIEKGLNHISKDYIEVNEMRSGDLMIKTPNLKVAEMFLKAKLIDVVPVKITLHKTLNSTQGRIFSRKIINLSQEELLQALALQKVIDVQKITKLEGNERVPTGAAIITFDLIRRPETIKIGWERVRVDEHIPNPMRCVNCQKLGHTKNRCKRVELCKECGFIPPHTTCLRKYCLNCENETHTSYDPSCPTYLKYKSVNKIKADRRCTARDAWKIFNDNPSLHTIQPFKKSSKTFSSVVRNNVDSSKQNTNSLSQTAIDNSNVNHSGNSIENNNKNISSTGMGTHNANKNKKDTITETAAATQNKQSKQKELKTSNLTTLKQKESKTLNTLSTLKQHPINKLRSTTTTTTDNEEEDTEMTTSSTYLNKNNSNTQNFLTKTNFKNTEQSSSDMEDDSI